MRNEKYVLKMNDDIHALILESLIEMKNRLQQEGSYTDAVDEVLVKYTPKLVHHSAYLFLSIF